MTQAINTPNAQAADVEFFLKKITPFEKEGKPGVLEFRLGNGMTLKAEVVKLPEAMKERLMYHGLSQKVGDAASGFSKGKDFQSAFDAMSEVLEHLIQGEWAKGSKERSLNIADLVEVIAKLKKLKPEDVQKTLEAMEEEQLKGFAKHPAIAAGLIDLKAKRRAEALKKQAKDAEAFTFELKL